MERVALVSKSDVPVLILGETGSGKEVVARAIHNGSPRAERPFIRVNCGAIPHELIDSPLFGHEKGAFTGATETRQGWFERADGGTLLLDELAELPLAAQVRLLRILQDGWLDRVGGQRPISVDVRIVASTHRDLPGMVAAGQFREDLWYRLAVFPIAIPSLRERREDIPELARHFARRAALRFGLYPAEPTLEDLQLLASYTWPGNVRELATVIDRAAILGDGKQLEVAKSLGVPTSPAAAVAASAVEAGAARPLAAKEIVPLDDAIRRHIEAALTATAGRIEGPRGAANLVEDQSAHLARTDAKAENRLEGIPRVASHKNFVAEESKPMTFDQAVSRLSQLSGKPIRPYATRDFGRDQNMDARSVVVSAENATRLLTELRRNLGPGVLAFIGCTRSLAQGAEKGSEVVVATGANQFDMFRVAQSDAVNYDMDTEDLVRKLQEYDAKYGINIFHAETDTIEIHVSVIS